MPALYQCPKGCSCLLCQLSEPVECASSSARIEHFEDDGCRRVPCRPGADPITTLHFGPREPQSRLVIETRGFAWMREWQREMAAKPKPSHPVYDSSAPAEKPVLEPEPVLRKSCEPKKKKEKTMIEKKSPIQQSLAEHVPSELTRLITAFADIGTCWIDIGGTVYLGRGDPSRLTPRSVRAMMLELPPGNSVEHPVEIRFGNQVAIVFEHGANLALVELPQGSPSRKSINRALRRAFLRIEKVAINAGRAYGETIASENSL